MNRRSQIGHQERKKELLQQCFQLLSEQGLENTGMRDLCKACGLSTNNSLYHYFGNKDNIIIECVGDALQKIEDKFFGMALDGSYDIEDFFQAIPGLAQQYQNEVALVYQVACSPKYRDRLAEYINRLPESYSETIEGLAEKLDCNPEELKPLVYLFITCVLDLMVFRDLRYNKVQFDYLHDQLQKICNK